VAASRRRVWIPAIWRGSGLASEDAVGRQRQLAGRGPPSWRYWGTGRWGRRSRASGSEEWKERLSRNWLARPGRLLNGCAAGGSKWMGVREYLSLDRGLLDGLLTAVSDGLQRLGS
jgi:hypothetical protein